MWFIEIDDVFIKQNRTARVVQLDVFVAECATHWGLHLINLMNGSLWILRWPSLYVTYILWPAYQLGRIESTPKESPRLLLDEQHLRSIRPFPRWTRTKRDYGAWTTE